MKTSMVVCLLLCAASVMEAQPFPIWLHQDGMLGWSNTVCAPCTCRVDKALSVAGPWTPVTNVVVTNRLGQIRVDLGPEPSGFFRIAALSTLGDGLLAYYPLDGDGRDASGHGHHAVMKGATVTTNRFGCMASALLFTNNPALLTPAAGCLTIADTPELRPTNALTIAVWFKASTANGRNLVSKELGTGLHDSLVMWYESGSAFMFQLEDTAGNAHHISTAIPTAGLWHHAAATWDGAVLRLYLDGSVVGSTPFTGAIRYDTNPIYIGADDNDGDDVPDEGWAGSVDEVRIYNRGLSSSEVSQIYHLPW